jgi:hypothetical protein
MSDNAANNMIIKTVEPTDKKSNIASNIVEVGEPIAVPLAESANNSCPSCGLMRKGYENTYHKCIRVLN